MKLLLRRTLVRFIHYQAWRRKEIQAGVIFHLPNQEQGDAVCDARKAKLKYGSGVKKISKQT